MLPAHKFSHLNCSPLAAGQLAVLWVSWPLLGTRSPWFRSYVKSWFEYVWNWCKECHHFWEFENRNPSSRFLQSFWLSLPEIYGFWSVVGPYIDSSTNPIIFLPFLHGGWASKLEQKFCHSNPATFCWFLIFLYLTDSQAKTSSKSSALRGTRFSDPFDGPHRVAPWKESDTFTRSDMMFVHTILLKDCHDSHDCMNFGPKQRDRVCLCLAAGFSTDNYLL